MLGLRLSSAFLCCLLFASFSDWLTTVTVVAQSESQCVVVQGETYSGSLCPSQQPQLTQTAPTSILQGVDDGSVTINLPFAFPAYGEEHTSVSINSNGYLSFGLDAPSIVPSVSGVGFPLDPSLVDSFPLIVPFFADLNVTSTGSITWSVEGVGGDLRTLVVRWNNVQYACSTCEGMAVSMDVLLYEGLNGRVDVRYYRVDSAGGALQVTLGTQSDEFFSWFPYFNALPVDDYMQSELLGSTLFLTYGGVSITQCGGLGYDLSNLTTQDIVYTTPTTNGGTTSLILYYRPCGIVSASVCAVNNSTRQSSLCSVAQTTAGGASAAEDLMVWNPNAPVWRYLPDGLMMILQDGQYCGVMGYPRVTVIQYRCDPTAIQAVITIYSESPMCVYNLNISTNLVCGEGLRNDPTSTYAPDSTLQACQVATGIGYDITWCPRPANAPYGRTLQPMTNETVLTVLASDDGVVTVPIGFTFWLYDTAFTQLGLSNNGMLEFGFASTNDWIDAPFPTMGLPSTDYFPIIAPLYTDLNDGFDEAAPLWNDFGYISYSVEGTAPSRQMFIRFYDVNLCLSRDTVGPHTVTFDVILSEGRPGGIEVRYYEIQINQGLDMLVGIHGLGATAYTALINATPLTVSLAAQLTSSTVTFTYNGPTAQRTCGGQLYNLSSISMDLSYTNASAGLTYTVHPCGRTTSSACAAQPSTADASICVSSADGSIVTPLAVDTPTASMYSMPVPGTLREIIQDGLFCDSTGNSSMTMVDYVCTPSASQPLLANAQRIAPCQYAFIVMTNTVCSGAANIGSVTGGTGMAGGTSSATLSSSSGVSGGALAGVIIGCVVGGAALMFAFQLLRSLSKRNPKQSVDEYKPQGKAVSQQSGIEESSNVSRTALCDCPTDCPKTDSEDNGVQMANVA